MGFVITQDHRGYWERTDGDVLKADEKVITVHGNFKFIEEETGKEWLECLCVDDQDVTKVYQKAGARIVLKEVVV